MGTGYSVLLAKRNGDADSKMLGVQLGHICIRKDIPVFYVAAKLGVSRQTIYNWFLGESTPSKARSAEVRALINSLKK